MKYVAIFAILLLAFTAQSNNKQYRFQVLFPGGLVSNEIAAQNYGAAIEVLEARARDPAGQYQDGELTILCALYVMAKQLAAAHNTCDAAVATDQSGAAYNNRGVLRVYLKNTQGALDDFNHAKQIYINTVIIADINRAEALRYAEARDAADFNALVDRVGGAEAEDLQ